MIEGGKCGRCKSYVKPSPSVLAGRGSIKRRCLIARVACIKMHINCAVLIETTRRGVFESAVAAVDRNSAKEKTIHFVYQQITTEKANWKWQPFASHHTLAALRKLVGKTLRKLYVQPESDAKASPPARCVLDQFERYSRLYRTRSRTSWPACQTVSRPDTTLRRLPFLERNCSINIESRLSQAVWLTIC